MIPPEGYLRGVAELCKKHNVLLICDEIQTVGLLILCMPHKSSSFFSHLGPMSNRQDARVRV